MQAVTVRRILSHYGLEAAEIAAVQKGYRNESYPVRLEDGRTVNLILYKREPGIVDTVRRANAVSRFLDGRGFPVRVPLDSRVVRVAAGGTARYAGVYTYLEGKTIPWEAYTQAHLKLLGQTMAEMHRALKGYDGPALPKVAAEYQAIVARMRRYFADPHVARAASDKLELAVPRRVFTRLWHILDFCEKLPGQQALHMDFVRSNILFDGDREPRIAGIIDFEKAASGHQLFDVARTLAFLLVDCKYKPTDKVRKYFLTSGYQRHGRRQLERITVQGSGKRRLLLEELVDLFLLYDFYKFLRHNPYEFLAQNEHYIRTRNLLLECGVITTTPIGSALAETLLQ